MAPDDHGVTPPAVGAKAPEIAAKCWVGPAAPETSGKCIVLEFWGSQSGPCAAAVPHLNALCERFGDKGIVFIAVTMDELDGAQAFLAGRPMQAHVALDPDGLVFGAYGVRSIPHAVLIDVGGSIRWAGAPASLDAARLTALLDGEHIEASPTGAAPATLRQRGDADVLVALTIARGVRGNGGYGACVDPEAQTLRAAGQAMALADAIAFLCDVLPTRVRALVAVPQEYVDVELVANGVDLGSMREAAADALAAAFGLRTEVVSEPTDGWALMPPIRDLPDVSTPGGGGHARQTHDLLTLTGTRMDEVALRLELALRCVVWDDTGLTGRYDLEIPSRSFDEAQGALAATYGLSLHPVRRAAEVLVIHAAAGRSNGVG
jgi:cytochrome c biogenesis protein CcmG, thiol:disulfide interchange protein DsbE